MSHRPVIVSLLQLTPHHPRTVTSAASLGPELSQVVQLRRRPLQERLKVLAARRVRVELRHEPGQILEYYRLGPLPAISTCCALVPRAVAPRPRQLVRVLRRMRVRTTKAVMHRVHRREHLPVHRADAVHPDAAVEVVGPPDPG